MVIDCSRFHGFPYPPMPRVSFLAAFFGQAGEILKPWHEECKRINQLTFEVGYEIRLLDENGFSGYCQFNEASDCFELAIKKEGRAVRLAYSFKNLKQCRAKILRYSVEKWIRGFDQELEGVKG